MASYSAIITSAEAGGQIFKIAASRFVNVSEEEMVSQQILTTRIVVDKTTDHAKPHSICFLPQYQRQPKKSLSRFVDSLKVHTLHCANELLVCVRLFFQKLLQTCSTCRSNKKKIILGKSNDAYSLSIRV